MQHRWKGKIKTPEKGKKWKHQKKKKLKRIVDLKYFFHEFYKNFRERCFLNDCSLVDLVNYIKLPLTPVFELISYLL